jgi:hypothetical protein
LLGGKNQYFYGNFSQSGGTTTVIGNFFSGCSSISAGLLEISTGADISIGTILLYNTSQMWITTPDNLIFYGNVYGTQDTFINKPSESTLTLSGDNSNFQGLYYQSAGLTKVVDSDYIFSGQITIETSSLQVTMSNNGSPRTIDYNVNISTGGILDHISTADDTLSTTIQVINIQFVGDNAFAIFRGSYTDINRGPDDSSWFVLNEPIQDFGSSNTVEFSDCYVDIDTNTNTYDGNTTWSFTNATIDMDYEDVFRSTSLPSILESTRTITFTNLLTTNTYLNTTVVMVSTQAQGSQLEANNNGAMQQQGKLGYDSSRRVKWRNGAYRVAYSAIIKWRYTI